MRRAERFLLIFDDIDNIDNTKKSSYVNLNKFISQYISVNIIVITRLSIAYRCGLFSVKVYNIKENKTLRLLFNSSELVLKQIIST